MPLTEAGASVGAAASPSGSSVARSPGASGTPASASGEQLEGSPGEAAGEATRGAPSAVAAGVATGVCARTLPAPAAGGRDTRTGPDHRPSSYGIPSEAAKRHHKSMTRGRPETGPPPRPKSRL